MTARSYTSEVHTHWYTFQTGVAEGYEGTGIPDYPPDSRFPGWFIDPDNQEIGEFFIWMGISLGMRIASVMEYSTASPRRPAGIRSLRCAT